MDELDSSELGTHAYWESAYKKEIANFDDNGDPGDVWFGEDSAYRVIRWICQNTANKDVSIIDLGCGNAYTLIELAKEGYTDLLGIDYCEEAITLAKKIAEKEYPNIKFKVFDITTNNPSDLGKFDIVHDKGTYDAVCLNPDQPKIQREMYIKQVQNILKENGFFVITSCNWTEQELLRQFSEAFDLKCVIPTPQFKFGGKVGSVVSSVVFVRK